MTLADTTYYLMLIGMPLLSTGLVLWRRLKGRGPSTGVIALGATVFLALTIVIFIPANVAGIIVNCAIHPGPDCEHFMDPCLKAFCTSENNDFDAGDRHTCIEHI